MYTPSTSRYRCRQSRCRRDARDAFPRGRGGGRFWAIFLARARVECLLFAPTVCHSLSASILPPIFIVRKPLLFVLLFVGPCLVSAHRRSSISNDNERRRKNNLRLITGQVSTRDWEAAFTRELEIKSPDKRGIRDAPTVQVPSLLFASGRTEALLRSASGGIGKLEKRLATRERALARVRRAVLNY